MIKTEKVPEESLSTKKGKRKMTNPQDKHRRKAHHTSHDEIDNHIDSAFEELAEAAEKTADQAEADAKEAVDEAEATAADLAAKLGQKNAQPSREEYETLRRELDEAKERGLRALAELENYRNRTNRAMAEDRKYAAVDLARAILPIWDNMGRALEAAEKDADLKSLVDGLKMMHQQFLDVFKANHIERIEAMGHPFNPHIHESISQIPSPGAAPNTIIAETQPGFRIFDRVIRPAQVVLAAPTAAK